MTRERKIRIMMELLDEQAVSIPAYLEEDYQRAIDAAFQKIEKLEKERAYARSGGEDNTESSY